MRASADCGDAIWDKVFKKNEDLVSRKIAGEMFLIPIKGKIANMQEIFTLNPVAEYIWTELDKERSLHDILTSVVQAFDVSREQGKEDIREFINELLHADIIKER